MSAWLSHLKSYYNEKKKSNPKYKFKTAMKEAVPSYRKSGKSGTKKHRKSRRRSRKSRSN